MKTVNPMQTPLVLKRLKPRNPILMALKASQGAKGGPHGKSRGALRRAEKMALAKELTDPDGDG